MSRIQQVIVVAVMCLGAVSVAPPAAIAAERPGIALIEFDGVVCTLRVDKPHFSPGSLDASVHSTTSCVEDAGPRSRFRADRIVMETTMNVFRPLELSASEVAECTSRPRLDRYRFELPCHGPWAGDGFYGATTTATVTVRGVTRQATATRVEQISLGDAPTMI